MHSSWLWLLETMRIFPLPSLPGLRNSSRLQQASGGVPFSGIGLWKFLTPLPAALSFLLLWSWGFEHVHPRVEELVTTHEEISESLMGAVTRACQDIGDDISDLNFKVAAICTFLFVSFLLSQEKAFENFFLHLYRQPYPFDSCGLEVFRFWTRASWS